MKDRRWKYLSKGLWPDIFFRQTNGLSGDPVGLGLRFFGWKFEEGWTYNVDLLFGPWDIQIAVRWWWPRKDGYPTPVSR